MKYYAVRKGNKPGIYETWEECKKEVEGVPSEYKAFSNKEEAIKYLNNEEEEINTTKPIAYVDGSFDAKTNRYSFGVVFLYEGNEYHFKQAFLEDDLVSMRNVAGEIKGASFIIQYCINRNIKEITIYHDYEGISKWYLNLWQAKLPGTQKYRDFATMAKEKIKVNFVKVKGHSNNKYNDLADSLAKSALGIK